MVEPKGWLYYSILGPVRRENIVPDVIFKSLPKDNSIGSVFSEVFLKSKIFLIIAVATAAEGKDLEASVPLNEILFKIPFRHHVWRTRDGFDLGITEQHDDDIAIRIPDRLSPVSKLINMAVTTHVLPSGHDL